MVLFLFAAPYFVRAKTRKSTPGGLCMFRLRLIDAAKEQWALEHPQLTNSMPSDAEISTYIKGGRPQCPLGGQYTFGNVGEQPRCSIAGHMLSP